MDMNDSFTKFNKVIKLDDSKKDKLKGNRLALRKKIKGHFEEREWKIPQFTSQGSFPLDTNLNPIKEKTPDGKTKEKYDLDDGVYFICPEKDRETVETYHQRIKNSVHGHTSETKDKNTCVRVVYEDGHHIDLPIYWMKDTDASPQLAHKSEGYKESDPKAFKDWVNEKISDTNQGDQLRRLIRYLKAWKDHRENENAGIKIPSGFVLTVLICNHYAENERDDIALEKTVSRILASLENSFTCYRPTPPEGENLLSRYNRESVLDELRKFVENAGKACKSTDEDTACKCWVKIFGDRFPSPPKKEGNSNNNKGPVVAGMAPIAVVTPSRPYGS